MIPFDEKSTSKLRELTELYIVTKELLLRAEEIPDRKADIQAIKELRDAFDHLMRANATIFGLKDSATDPQDFDQNEYIFRNTDKAYGHVYRAGYDTLDWICLKLRKTISDEMKDFSTNTISAVFPAYYSEIKPDIEEISKKIAGARNEKDVAVKNFEGFIKYARLSDKLFDYCQQVIKKKPSLNEYENKLKKQDRKTFLKEIIVKIVIAIIAVALSVSATLYFTRRHTTYPKEKNTSITSSSSKETVGIPKSSRQ